MGDNVGISTESIGAGSSSSSDWRAFLTDDLKADPVVSGWAEKASEKDIPSVLKSYAHLSKRLGSSVNIPGKDAKPEEIEAFKGKLYEAGLFSKPPTDPKEYGIAAPAELPPGVKWSEELAGKLGSVLHKHGIPKGAAPELLALHMEALAGSAPTLNVNQEQAMAQLRAEHGDQFDQRADMVKRMSGSIFKTPEEVQFFEQSGLGDHPAFLSVLMRLAPLAMQDSSFVESIPSGNGELTPEQVRSEYAEIISNPKHPMHEGLHRRDPKVEEYVTNLYNRAYGGH